MARAEIERGAFIWCKLLCVGCNFHPYMNQSLRKGLMAWLFFHLQEAGRKEGRKKKSKLNRINEPSHIVLFLL